MCCAATPCRLTIREGKGWGGGGGGKEHRQMRVLGTNTECSPPFRSYLDATTNGLTYVVDRLKGVSMYGHVTLKTTVRSSLAAVAAEML